VDHISPTQINMYLRCPQQYAFRYMEGLILPPKAALTRGRAVHRGQEANYRQKIESKTDLPLADVQDVVSTEFDAAAQETEWALDENRGQVKDESISLASLYHREIAPTVQPDFVEEEVFVELEPGLNLKGFIDVVQSGGIIRDTKTTGKTPPADVADKSLQLTAYSLAYRSLTGQAEAELCLDYLVNTKQPKVVTLRTSRVEDDVKRFRATAERISKAIQTGIFYPREEGNNLCSPQYCGYYQLCHSKR
jgi:putative RecB family exonuclease